MPGVGLYFSLLGEPVLENPPTVHEMRLVKFTSSL